MVDLRGTKILAIDDDAELLRLLSRVFDRAHAQLVTASDGVEGLRRFRHQQPDLVLLDLKMPEMDGWEVCQRIRGCSDVGVIMFTCLRREEDIVHGLSCGADDYITKPVDLDVLLARIRAVLRRVSSRLQ